MAYKKGEDRRQKVLFPDCIDDYVGQDAPFRLMDAFIDRLDMEKLGFQRFVPADTGAPGYDPRDLMKLYVYGYYYEVRSSRKLARLDQHITRYMEELDEYDAEEERKLSRGELEYKLEVCRNRKERYEGYREQLERNATWSIALRARFFGKRPSNGTG